MIERYDASKHREVIECWYRGWKQVPPHPRALSQNGFIADGICALWLFLTDAEIAYVDCAISDPKATREARHTALGKATAAAEELARECGCIAVIMQTTRQRVADACAGLGWQIFPNYLVGMKVFKE